MVRGLDLLLLTRLLLLILARLLLSSSSRTRPQTTTASLLGAAITRLLLVLDPAVLEPDLDLFLGEPQVGGDLDTAQTRQVHVGRELSLQLQQLGAGEGCPDALAAGRVTLRAGAVSVR